MSDIWGDALYPLTSLDDAVCVCACACMFVCVFVREWRASHPAPAPNCSLPNADWNSTTSFFVQFSMHFFKNHFAKATRISVAAALSTHNTN